MCNKFLKSGLLYFYGELKDVARPFRVALFEKHLKECETCSKQLEELKTISNLCASLPLEEPTPLLIAEILKESHKIVGTNSIRAKKENIVTFIVLSHILRSIKIRWSIGAVIGSILIFIIIGHFLPQSSHKLEWNNGIDTKITTISERIQNLAYSYNSEEILLTNLDTRVDGLYEKIETLKSK